MDLRLWPTMWALQSTRGVSVESFPRKLSVPASSSLSDYTQGRGFYFGQYSLEYMSNSAVP